MNREYNSRVSSKNSERLLKNLKNTTGDYFFLPHPVDSGNIMYMQIFAGASRFCIDLGPLRASSFLVDL